MSGDQSLRDLVCARLTAAAEEIFALFDKTILKYEEELGRSRQENQEKQKLLESVLNPMIPLVRVSAQILSPFPPETAVKQEHTEIPQIIKREQEEESIKQEEELPSPESTDIFMKSEEHQQENISPVPEWEKQTENSSNPFNINDNKDWVCPLSPAECPETEVDERYCKQVQKRIKKSVSGIGALENNVVMPDTDGGAKGKMSQGITVFKDEGTESNKHQCPVCKRNYKSEIDLRINKSVHTGERLFDCSTCMKTFTRHSNVKLHKRTHTGEKPFVCTVCNTAFTRKASLTVHKRIHTGEKPFCCTVCNKTFTRKDALQLHKLIHTGEKSFSCTICKKKFSLKHTLHKHTRIHTKEKPYKCTVCGKAFSQSAHLNRHMRLHTGEQTKYINSL